MGLEFLEAVTVKAEVTYRTDPTPAGADAVQVLSISPNLAESVRVVERNTRQSTLGRLKPIFGGRLISLELEVECKGSGTAGTEPEFDALLEACGLTGVNSPATSETYAPDTTNTKSCTIYYYFDGLLQKITGCRGNVVFSFTPDGLMMTFSMIGHPSGEITDIAIPTLTFDATDRLPFIGATFTIGGFAAVINELNIDLGNVVSQSVDVNQANGFGQMRITDRNPIGSINPEMTLIANNDWLNDFTQGSELALATGVIGGTAGNKVDLSAVKAVYTGFNLDSREGARVAAMPFMLQEDTGDDQLSLVFT